MQEILASEPHRILQIGDVEVVLLGTAHVSPASVQAVNALLATESFDAVAVELCESRRRAMFDPDAMSRLDLMSVMRNKQVALVAASLALGAYQLRIAEQYGIAPGAELRASIDGALARGLPLALIDRDIGLTLRRTYASIPWWRRSELAMGLVLGVMTREKVDEAEIERLKQGDMLESTFSEFAEQSEQIYRPVIDERDRYMAAQIRRLAAQRNGIGGRVLAVVGAGHLAGIERYLQEGERNPEDEIVELEQAPPRPRWPRVLPWVIVGVILVGFAIGFSRDLNIGKQMVIDWFVINGGLAAIGGIIALAHPLTILVAALGAPITTLNPTIGIGFVAAAVEIWLRKPQVGDFATMRRDVMHWKGWWSNRVARVLLVFLLTTIGSVIGTYVAGARLFGLLVGAGE